MAKQSHWDRSLAGLCELQRLLQPAATVVGLNPSSNEFPVDEVNRVGGLRFIDLSDNGTVQRFLHAKIVVAETKGWDHVLFGSANCSDDALGTAVAGGRNAETCVYRRLRQGEAGRLLDIDYEQEIAFASIRPVRHTPFDDEGIDGDGFDPGVMELFGKCLTWWPSRGTEAQGAVALVGERECAVVQRGNSWDARLVGDFTFPLVVRMRLADGRVSSPCIAQNQNALRQAAPGLMDRRLRSAFDRVLSGDEDIIDLALDAQVLFSTDETEKDSAGHARGGRAKADHDGYGDMKNAEEFRKSVQSSKKSAPSGEISLSDPGLLELLRIVLRGVMDVGGRGNDAGDDQEEAITAGETEDGEEGTESDQPPVVNAKSEREFTASAIALRRRKLSQAIGAFEEMIGKLESTGSPVTSRLAAQTNFIISLMLYACTYENKMEGGRSVRLMEMVPRENNRDVFAVMAPRLLKRIWVGKQAVVNRIMIDRRFGSLPDDLCAFIVMTRWAVGRAVVAVMALPRRINFEKMLVKAALEIFKATGTQVEVAGDFEAAFMRRLDTSLGFSEEQTARLVHQCRHLMAQLH